MKVLGTKNFNKPSKLLEQSFEVIPLYFTYVRHKTQNFNWSQLFDILIVRQLIVNEPLDRRTFYSSDVWFVPQDNVKILQVEEWNE